MHEPLLLYLWNSLCAAEQIFEAIPGQQGKKFPKLAIPYSKREDLTTALQDAWCGVNS